MPGPARVAKLPFTDSRILLGVTGGIAAYKSIALARELTLAGSAVDVVLTSGARQFVQPLSFEALTGRPVLTELYAPGDPLLHIRLARQSHLVLIAPATANFVARAAAGMADDLLTCTLLATEAPVLVCPAMNDRMYAHPQTRSNLERLREIGYTTAGPAEGLLAWGEGSGPGRMIEIDEIMQHAARALTGETPLTGKSVLVTAGGTREAIDPVRYIGNRSSGRMGVAIATAALRKGARVTMVSASTSVEPPAGVVLVQVESAAEMAEAVERALPDADVIIMAAAVADFTPLTPASEKIKKGSGSAPELKLGPTTDILKATIGRRRQDAITVGFALETEAPVENGRRKLVEKKLDLLVVNDAREAGAGFEVETNRVTLLDATGRDEELPLLSKDEVADRILERVAALLDARTP